MRLVCVIVRALTCAGLLATVVTQLCLVSAHAGELELSPADRSVPLGVRPDERQQSTLNQTASQSGGGGFSPLLDVFTDSGHYVRRFSVPVGLLVMRFEISGVPLRNGLPPVMDARCTATLIAADLIITAHHCVPGDEPNAKLIEARLFMGWDQDGLNLDSLQFFEVDTKPVTYKTKLNASPGSMLDYAIVQVRPGSDGKLPGELFNPMPIVWKDIYAGALLLLIQHPDGQAKRVTRDCHHHRAPEDQLLIGGPNGREFRHRCATRPGSSGALVLQDDPTLILGLHNKGSFVHDFQTWQFNEAVAFSRIMSDPNSTILQTLARWNHGKSGAPVLALLDRRGPGTLNVGPDKDAATGPFLVPVDIGNDAPKTAAADASITYESSAPGARITSVKLPRGLTQDLIFALTPPGVRDIEPPSRVKWTKEAFTVVDEQRTLVGRETGVSDFSKTNEGLWVIRSNSEQLAIPSSGALTDYAEIQKVQVSLPGDIFGLLSDSTTRYGSITRDARGQAKKDAPWLSSASVRVLEVAIEGGGSCTAQSCSISYWESCEAQGAQLECRPDSSRARAGSTPRVGRQEKKVTIETAQEGAFTVVSSRQTVGTMTVKLTQRIKPGFGVISAKRQVVSGSGRRRLEQVYTVIP
jgi:hypothetical protein